MRQPPHPSTQGVILEAATKVQYHGPVTEERSSFYSYSTELPMLTAPPNRVDEMCCKRLPHQLHTGVHSDSDR
jgi:hypothetical protein